MGNLSQIVVYNEKSSNEYNNHPTIKEIKKKLKQHSDYIKLFDEIYTSKQWKEKEEINKAADLLFLHLKNDVKNQCIDLFKDEITSPAIANSLKVRRRPGEKNQVELFDSSKFTNTPRANISQICNIAEKLDMVIIPDAYFNTSSYSNEHWETRGLIDRITRQASSESLRPWFLTPISNYSVTKHMKSQTEIEFFSGQKIAMAIIAIKMIIPTLRGMQNQIDALDYNDKLKTQQLQTLERTVKEQSVQISRLSDQIERQRELELRRQAEIRQIQLLNEQSLFSIQDPMMVLLPDNVTDIHSYRGEVILGPVWGPDINNIVFELLDLKIIRDTKAHNSLLQGLI